MYVDLVGLDRMYQNIRFDIGYKSVSHTKHLNIQKPDA